MGGGSAGCVLANRLSANPQHRVLLVEAGGPETNPLIQSPGKWPSLLGPALDGKLSAEPEPGLHRSSLIQQVIEGRLDEVRPDQRPVDVEVAGGQGGLSSRRCEVESRRVPETLANT